jgi:hypothetical protein
VAVMLVASPVDAVVFLSQAKAHYAQPRVMPGGDALGVSYLVMAGSVRECRRLRPASARALATRRRSLLRYLFLAGYTPHQGHRPCLPRPAGGAGSLPRGARAATLRTQITNIATRLSHHARTLTLHLLRL